MITDISPGGIFHRSEMDQETGALIITRLQNVEPVLEFNKMLRGLGKSHYRGEDGTFWHYARVPLIFMEKWIREFGPEVVFGEDDDTIVKLIERDYPYFKCGEFRLA
ncbi:hypothetical protein [Acidiphilium sp.]|uniref:hypothetical protein n=1 Tax=Acidiphilium sp. TaxID=527 RepID=UPI00258DB656|nr:hypothetical protein [Acidiphilium sp.]